MSVAFSIAESIINASIISDALTAEDRSKELSPKNPYLIVHVRLSLGIDYPASTNGYYNGTTRVIPSEHADWIFLVFGENQSGCMFSGDFRSELVGSFESDKASLL